MIRPLACSLALLALAAAAPLRAGDLDAIVRPAMQRASIPGLVVAVLRDGKTIEEAAFGKASLELDVAATPATVFPIASVTKLFTAALVMQQVEQGRLGLDDRAGDLLPDLPEAWRGVTLRQMLAHTSGLPDVIANPMTGEWLAATRDAALAKAAALPMQFAPGTGWSYNQTNYVLLAAIVERLAGRPLEAQLQTAILEPLAMQATRWGDAAVVVPGRGPWYSRLDFSGPEPRLARAVHPTWVAYPDFVHACAGLNTTAVELARFVDAVASGKLLKPATVERMWQAQTLLDGKPAGMDAAMRMGLGWLIEDLDGGAIVGGTGGATVALRHAVAERLTVVVLTNCQGSDADGLATAILKHFLGSRAAK